MCVCVCVCIRGEVCVSVCRTVCVKGEGGESGWQVQTVKRRPVEKQEGR